MTELCLLVLVLYKSFVYSSKSSRVPFRRSWFWRMSGILRPCSQDSEIALTIWQWFELRDTDVERARIKSISIPTSAMSIVCYPSLS